MIFTLILVSNIHPYLYLPFTVQVSNEYPQGMGKYMGNFLRCRLIIPELSPIYCNSITLTHVILYLATPHGVIYFTNLPHHNKWKINYVFILSLYLPMENMSYSEAVSYMWCPELTSICSMWKYSNQLPIHINLENWYL